MSQKTLIETYKGFEIYLCVLGKGGSYFYNATLDKYTAHGNTLDEIKSEIDKLYKTASQYGITIAKTSEIFYNNQVVIPQNVTLPTGVGIDGFIVTEHVGYNPTDIAEIAEFVHWRQVEDYKRMIAFIKSKQHKRKSKR